MNLRALRLESGFSQKKLAGLLGISYQQLQKYEQGGNRLTVERLLQLCDVFNVPMSAFLSGIAVPDRDLQTALWKNPRLGRIVMRLVFAADMAKRDQAMRIVDILIPD